VSSPTWSIIDDKDAGWAWNGWSPSNSASYYNGSIHVALGGSGVYSGQHAFTGSTIEVYSAKSPNAGSIQVYIDGVSYGTFSLYNTSNQFQQLIASITGLTPTTHTILLMSRANATQLAGVDYLRVDTSGTIGGAVVPTNTGVPTFQPATK
jgi:hypothetical protein